jgi:hypothetical protein
MQAQPSNPSIHTSQRLVRGLCVHGQCIINKTLSIRPHALNQRLTRRLLAAWRDVIEVGPYFAGYGEEHIGDHPGSEQQSWNPIIATRPGQRKIKSSLSGTVSPHSSTPWFLIITLQPRLHLLTQASSSQTPSARRPLRLARLHGDLPSFRQMQVLHQDPRMQNLLSKSRQHPAARRVLTLQAMFLISSVFLRQVKASG